MADLRVNLCGVSFRNPVIAASGTFGFGEEYSNYVDFDRIGGIALKALTKEPRQGNKSPRIAETASGVLNSVGLQNPGVDAFLREKYPRINGFDTVLIANIAGASEEDYLYVAQRLNDTDIQLYELNVSCPNVACGGIGFGTEPKVLERLVRCVKSVSSKPLIVKLTPNVTDITEIARAAAYGGADAFSLINTFTGIAIDAYTRRPVLANITGGLSGPAIKPIALRMVHQLYRSKIGLPIIGMGGIMNGIDAAEFIIGGADAVMVGTATLVKPCAVQDIAEELDTFFNSQNIGTISSVKGTLII